MPSAAIKTIREEIYYQYAKIISQSSGFGKNNYAMIIAIWKKLCNGEIQWSTNVREWLKEHENPNICIYCGKETDLTIEHILPRDCGGENVVDNVIRVCQHCNSSKNNKRLYEWFGFQEKDKINRIAEGKYLKYLYSLHERAGTLDCIPQELCVRCNMQAKCIEAGKAQKINVFCLEGCFYKENHKKQHII